MARGQWAAGRAQRGNRRTSRPARAPPAPPHDPGALALTGQRPLGAGLHVALIQRTNLHNFRQSEALPGRFLVQKVEILDWKTKKQLCFLDKVEPNATIREIRLMFHKLYPRWYPARQSIKLDPKGKSLRDEEILQHLPVGTTATLYFKDLGPQIGWTTVFLIEYTGPLFIYFLFYFRMPFVYGLDERFTSSPHPVVKTAFITGDLQLGLLITSIILFTLLLLMGKNR